MLWINNILHLQIAIGWLENHINEERNVYSFSKRDIKLQKCHLQIKRLSMLSKRSHILKRVFYDGFTAAFSLSNIEVLFLKFQN